MLTIVFIIPPSAGELAEGLEENMFMCKTCLFPQKHISYCPNIRGYRPEKSIHCWNGHSDKRKQNAKSQYSVPSIESAY